MLLSAQYIFLLSFDAAEAVAVQLLLLYCSSTFFLFALLSRKLLLLLRFFAAAAVVAVSCCHRINCCNGTYCIFNEVALAIDIVPVVVAAAVAPFAVLYIDGIANVSLLLLL